MFTELTNTFRKAVGEKGAFTPFPRACERDAWNAVHPAVRASVIEMARPYAKRTWPPLPAGLYLDYRRTGNRARYQAPYFERRTGLGVLTAAECLSGNGEYLRAIIDVVWAICEESTWVLPAHNRRRESGLHAGLPDPENVEIDLFAAETGAELAAVAYLLEPQLAAEAPMVLKRISAEVRNRILLPYYERTDQWWMGYDVKRPLNNWTPWCTSNCLFCVFLQESDHDRRIAAIEKAAYSLDQFVETYHEDGGCDEGASYWNRAAASLFDCIEVLDQATGSASRLYAAPLVKNMMSYLGRAHICDDWFLNFADGPARMTPRAGLIYRIGQAVNDHTLTALAEATLARHGIELLASADRGSLNRCIPDLLGSGSIPHRSTRVPHEPITWMNGVQVLVGRCATGVFLGAKGGHNGESHNHNDVGNVVVFNDCRPVLIDIGVEEYTAKTFSDRRYEIWTMQSSFHNLPEINGRMQVPGTESRASIIGYEQESGRAVLEMDIAGTYPQEAGAERWRRTVCVDTRGAENPVTLTDEYELRMALPVVLNYLTAYRPRIDTGSSGISLSIPDAHAALYIRTKARCAATVEEHEVKDKRLAGIWGPVLFRTRIKVPPARAGMITTTVGTNDRHPDT